MNIELSHPTTVSTNAELDQILVERDALLQICQEQAALLQTIAQNCIVLDRDAFREQIPTLMKAPAPSRGAFITLLADTSPNGDSEQAWTGLRLGAEMGLAKATRDRLVGPLEAGGIVEATETERRKAAHYRLRALVNTTLSERIRDLQIRFQSVLVNPREYGGLHTTTLPERSTSTLIRSQSVQMGQNEANTLPERITALVCMYESDSDISLDESQTNKSGGIDEPLISPKELNILKPYLRGMGISSKALKQILPHPAEYVLGCILHIRDSRNVHSPAGLFMRILAAHDPVQAKYLDQAREILAPRTTVDVLLIEPDDPEYLTAIRREALPHCPRCNGQGWYRTWNPIDPWDRCPCHLMPQEPSVDEQAELKSRANPECQHCKGQGWSLSSFDPDHIPWTSCFCVDRPSVKPRSTEAGLYPADSAGEHSGCDCVQRPPLAAVS
jgi:hypothetical protein